MDGGETHESYSAPPPAPHAAPQTQTQPVGDGIPEDSLERVILEELTRTEIPDDSLE